MKIAIIAGSHRQNSESSRIAHYLCHAYQKLFPKDQVDVLSLAGSPVPYFDESYWQEGNAWHAAWAKMSATLAAADGIIVVVPEWSGMAPAGLRNLFQLASNGELSHKPGLLVGISSTMGGAYPVAELRMSSSKNTKICYIPDHLIIRHCVNMLHDGPPQSPEDAYIRERITYTLKVFETYTKAFGTIRASGVTATDKFRNGM